MKKNLKQKLDLSKTTIANLTHSELLKVLAGESDYQHSCGYQATTCPGMEFCNNAGAGTQGQSCNPGITQ